MTLKSQLEMPAVATAMTLAHFVETHCAGKEFDSCCNSPCRHSSAGGCQHALHPRNNHHRTNIGEASVE